ncbi:MAG: alpha/beta hydrolase [Polyangiales bacterium]
MASIAMQTRSFLMTSFAAAGLVAAPGAATVVAQVRGDSATSAACNPADRTPPAKIIQYSGKDSPLWENGAKWYEPSAVTNTDTPNTGPYEITIEVDPTAPTFTVYRPKVKDRPLPIVAWANGGCIQDGTMMGELLKEIATHGFLIIADGAPGGFWFSPSDGTRQKAMIDWALRENERPCSTYHHTLDTQKIAVAGNSCGGLMTFTAAADPRVATTVLFNSGLFSRDQKLYDGLHTPLAIFNGGPEDPAYANAQADIRAITKVPVLFANDKRGHAGYHWDDNGGEAAKAGVAWFNWQLRGDLGPAGKEMFVGPSCGLCKAKKVWTDVTWKNAELLHP